LCLVFSNDMLHLPSPAFKVSNEFRCFVVINGYTFLLVLLKQVYFGYIIINSCCTSNEMENVETEFFLFCVYGSVFLRVTFFVKSYIHTVHIQPRYVCSRDLYVSESEIGIEKILFLTKWLRF